MAQDIRNLFDEENKMGKANLSIDHLEKMEQKLAMAFPQQQKKYNFLKIAAVIILAVFGSYMIYNLSSEEGIVKEKVVDTDPKQELKTVPANLSLGDISPELKKVEQYYVTNINLELAQLSATSENKQLLDGFLNQLANLDQEYKQLTIELNEIGPNEKTVTALIENLQFKLQLLYQLKNKLNELKESKNEQFKNQHA